MNKDSYDPLLTGDYGEDTILENTSRLSHGSTRRNSLSSYLIAASKIFPWILSFILATIIIYDSTNGWDRFRQHKLYASQQAYSPAQNEIEYKLTKFHTNIVDAPDEFQGGPSETLNKAWDDLFNFGISTIPKAQAKLLPNYTSPVPGHEDEYIVELDVFHQLHCLNIFRKAFTPIYLSDWEYVKDAEVSLNWTVPRSYPYEAFEENRVKNSINPWHIGHCLESLRQSIMCHADITPAVWHWDYSVPNPIRNKPWLTVLHTCRDFDRIRDWAKKRKIRWDFDDDVEIPQQFDIPTYP
ncbi:hypothetical protein CFAM422_006618 [Trichoderma lentiforme]|uniref:Tat pathway signal sequence protein n=1 Tax=Trichoderma lentiforme TaxID=1567552 RepID=A0A9P5CEA7_9HYPO|nr:hypothetical protein CFAM422_006618 [Trichoderma lentiforme]